MKNIFLSAVLLMLIIVSIKGFAQSSAIVDSLLRELRLSRSDTNKVTILNGLAYEKRFNNFKEALIYGEEALRLSTQLGYEKGSAKSLLVIGTLYNNEGNHQKAESCFWKALNIGRKINNSSIITLGYAKLSAIYRRINDYHKAIGYDMKALLFAKQSNDKSLLSKCLYDLGIDYKYLGDYNQAIKYILEALRIAELNNDSENISNNATTLGNLFMTQGNIQKAEEYYLLAIRLSEKINRKDLISRSSHSIGNLYFVREEYDKALYYFDRALKTSRELGNLHFVSGCLEGIGSVHINRGEPQKAINALNEAITICKKTKDHSLLASLLQNLGWAYKEKGEYREAVSHLYKSIKLSQEVEDKETAKAAYESLYELYTEIGNHQQALKNYKLYTQYKDSLMNEATANKMNELNIQYETEKKEQQIKTLSQQAQIQQLELKQQRLYIIGLAIIAMLVGVAGYLFYRQRILRNRQKTVEMEQKMLRTQMNPHFMFNALMSIQRFVYESKPEEAGEYLTKFAKLMRMILENSRQEYITVAQEVQTLEYYLQLQQIRLKHKFDYRIEVDPQIDPEEVAMPPMFAQPLIENSLEHGILHKSEKGFIRVRYGLEGDMIRFEVEDDGVGRQKATELRAIARAGHQSMATQITKERLSVLHKKARFELVDLVGEGNTILGTKASLLIPVKFV